MASGTSAMLRNHSRLATLVISVAMIALFLVLVEVGFRTAAYVVKGPVERRVNTVLDGELGWTLNPAQAPLTRVNRCGETVTRAPPVSRYVVKAPRHANDTTVLFLGDSFTQAQAVSTGEAYYDVFEALNPERYAVYAAGVKSYGSLQEYLLLREVSDEVQPDIVLWQMCQNDVADNVYELERARIWAGKRPRPYVDPESGAIITRYPGLVSTTDRSHAFRYLFRKMSQLDTKYDLGITTGLGALLEPGPRRYAELEAKGYEVTRWALERAMAENPQTLFIGFEACGGGVSAENSRVDDAFEEVFLESGARYFPRFYTRVARAGNTDCRPADPHWNRKGHRVAGETLNRLLSDLLHGQPHATLR